MATKGDIVSDLELRFTQGKPSDDLELERDQIAFWVDTAANTFLSDYLSRQIAKGGDINPIYISKSAYKTASSESLSEVVDNYERYGIDISDLNILPVRGFGRDYGVLRVHDEENKQLIPITADDSDYNKYLCFAKPSDNNIQWYRESNKIYLDGVNINIATFKKFRAFYFGAIDSSALLDTAEYPLDADVLSLVIDMAEEIGWRQIRQPINDLENNGKQ